jgi:RHS repeat-associated protein
VTDEDGQVVARQIHYPFGEVRWAEGSPHTDYGYAGQRYDVGSALLFLHARYYDPALGRFISADTIVPEPGNPQDFNRYSYCRNSPLVYTDPSGHIRNEPDELTRADEILQILLDEYEVTITRDWGWLGVGSLWNPGSWRLVELETVLEGVNNLAGMMGGAQRFRDNLGGVEFVRSAIDNPAQATAHRVRLRSIGSGGFMGEWQGAWTVVHELAHAWDAANDWQLSKDLERYTEGRTTLWGRYDWAGTPPKGADSNFTRREDFAESVAAFVYPSVAQAFIRTFYSDEPEYHYTNYYSLPRARFVANLVNMDPSQLLFMQGSRW